MLLGMCLGANLECFLHGLLHIGATTLLTCLTALAEQLEGALLGLVTRSEQMLLGRLLTKCMLAAADNPAMLILHQILLCQTTSCLIGGAVPNLSLGTYCHLILKTTKK